MNRKLLIVDDDPDIRRVLRGLLEPLGPVAEAAGGGDALKILRAEGARLMLLDVSMPDMSGLEVLRAARTIRPGLPVLMLTGLADMKIANAALKAGAAAFITKPFDSDALVAEVRRAADPGGAGPEPERPWRVRR